MRGLVERHRSRLPSTVHEGAITLGEGATPLRPLENIVRRYGLGFDLYCKFEGTNPTGSFKDRGMAAAISHARARKCKAVVCASTGNTSASAAAYSAAAGIQCLVLMPEGKVAAGKVAQAIMHNAQLLEVRGSFDDAMELVKGLGEEMPIEIVNSTNPIRLQGQKTIAFEVIEQLGRPPDFHALPVGNAGNITAHWIGYCEASGTATKACSLCRGEDCAFAAGGAQTSRPHMVGYQAAGSAPFIEGGPVERPETVATAIRIGNPQSWHGARTAVADSDGWFAAVDDERILEAQFLLASTEGIFCEPASAAPIAGVLADAKDGRFPSGTTVVCTVTGHGLKDPSVAGARMRSRKIEPDLDELKNAIRMNDEK